MARTDCLSVIYRVLLIPSHEGRVKLNLCSASMVSGSRPGTVLVGPGIFTEVFQTWPRKADETFFFFPLSI